MKLREVSFSSPRVKKVEDICFPGDAYYQTQLPVKAWILKDSDVDVGFCYLTILDDSTAFLSRAGVVPDFRGKGLQKRLISVRERYARKVGISQLITYTLTSNLASSNNLIRCGYTLYTPSEAYAGTSSLYWNKIMG